MTDTHGLGPDIDLDVEVVRDKKVGGSPRPERSGSPRRRWPRPGQTPLAHGPAGPVPGGQGEGARRDEAPARAGSEAPWRDDLDADP